MKYKVWAISLCYNTAEVIRASLEQYRRTASKEVETVHVLVDQHWPLKRTETRLELEKLAGGLNGILLDPGVNLGLARGFNWALKQLPVPDNAGVIGYDPDSWPADHDWDLAMCEAFVNNPDAAWFSLWHPHAERELLGDRRGKDLGNGLVQAESAVMNSVCMFRQEWLRKVGGLHEDNPLYGGLEVHTFKKLDKWKWLFLKNYREIFWPHPEMLNKDYREWKYATTHGGEKQIEFGEWLRAKNYRT